MTLTIHRGSHEIGGICIEVSNTRGERILLDAGRPLEDHPDGTALDQERLAQAVAATNLRGKLLAVVYSHGHQDHLGFDGLVDPEIARWMGADTLAFYRLRQAAGFMRNRAGQHDPVWEHYATYSSEVPFMVGQFRITPWLMDHSAMDSYALEVESDGQRVLFTGDFRAHGRKARVLDTLLKKVRPCPDVLLSEGTTMSRQDAVSPVSERAIEDKLVELAKATPGQLFVQCSAENIDRLVGLYRACLRSGRTLVVDLYTALVLQTAAVHHQSIPCPGRIGWEQVKVWYPQPLTRRLVGTLGQDATVHHFKEVQLKRRDFAQAGKLMLLVRPTMQKELAHWLPEIGEHAFVYSMWSGYLKDPKTAAFVDFMSGKGAPLHLVHTSGHADPKTIRRVVETLKPAVLVPVHTEAHRAFVFKEQYVRELEDGEVFLCSTIERVDNNKQPIPTSELGKQFKEFASWQLAAALTAQYPERYRVVEQHPGGGMYDVLALYARGSGEPEARINRNGSFHNRQYQGMASIWERMANGQPLHSVLGLCHEMMSLPPPEARHVLSDKDSASHIAVAFMAEVMGLIPDDHTYCEWRMGLLDSSDWSSLRQDGFDAFPTATAWLDHTPEDKQLWDWCSAPYDIWFLYANNVPLAVLHISGCFQIKGDVERDLRKECRSDGWNVGQTARRMFTSKELGNV